MDTSPGEPIEGKPKLTIELVPSTCWFSNVRDHVDAATWDRLRRQTYRDVNRKCAVCGGVGPKWPVECHEVWDYDDERHVQKLVGLTGLCPTCHEAKHMGLANTRGRGEDARKHLARVNGWTVQFTDRYVADAFEVWRERSQQEWTLDLDWLERLGIQVESRRDDPGYVESRAAEANPFEGLVTVKPFDGKTFGGLDLTAPEDERPKRRGGKKC